MFLVHIRGEDSETPKINVGRPYATTTYVDFVGILLLVHRARKAPQKAFRRLF